jgi:hypothetical protein
MKWVCGFLSFFILTMAVVCIAGARYQPLTSSVKELKVIFLAEIQGLGGIIVQ